MSQSSGALHSVMDGILQLMPLLERVFGSSLDMYGEEAL